VGSPVPLHSFEPSPQGLNRRAHEGDPRGSEGARREAWQPPPARRPLSWNARQRRHEWRARKRAWELLPVIEQIRSTGTVSLGAIAAELQRMDVSTPSGRGSWHPVTVARTLAAADRSPSA
jgi:hypothetical protein